MTASEQPNYVLPLTGLRFVAAAMVFWAHLHALWPQLGTLVFPLGAVGVGFFFVLSGFILTYVYGRDLEKFSVRDFYVRRIARIWPLHLCVMLLVLVSVITWSGQISRPNGFAKLIANAFLIQSWVPDRNWVFSINGPSWSLSVEAGCYLLFPLLVAGGFAAFRKKLVGICLAVVSVLMFLQFVPIPGLSESGIRFFILANPLMRLFDFSIGMACGFLYLKASSENRSASPGWVVSTFKEFGALALCITFFAILHQFSIYETGPHSILETVRRWLHVSGAAPLFALVIFVFASSRGLLSTVLSHRSIVFLGEISFAFYLIHQPIQVQMSRIRLEESPFALAQIIGASLLLTIAASILLHCLIELPCRTAIIQLYQRRGLTRSFLSFPTFGKKLLLSRAAPVVVVLCLSGFWLSKQGTFDFREQARLKSVVRQSRDEFRNIQFDNDAILHGLTTNVNADGSCCLNMVWQLNEEGQRTVRFMHVCDDKGQILRQVNINLSMFGSVDGDDTVLDQVTLTPQQLEGASRLAVGFCSPKLKMAPIINRPPGHERYRLNVLRLDSHSRMASQAFSSPTQNR